VRRVGCIEGAAERLVSKIDDGRLRWGDHFYDLSAHHLFYDSCGFGRGLAGLARDEHHLLDLDLVLEFVLFGHDDG
jgi:hypothetical protein